MSDLLTRLRKKAKTHTKQTGPKCGVCTLPPETLDVLRQLRSEGITNSALGRTLQDEGFKVKANTVSRHFLDHERRQ